MGERRHVCGVPVAAVYARRLMLGQPSQTNVNVAHAILVQDPTAELRFSNFVELMCPFFHVRRGGYVCWFDR